MVGPISDAKVVREIGTAEARLQSSPASPHSPDPATSLRSDKRVEALQQTVESLIRGSMPSNAKLQIDQDEETGAFIYRSVNPDTGDIIEQWPPEQLLKLRASLRELEGMLVDKTV